MPTNVKKENLFLKSLNTKPPQTYVDGNPCPNVREARKVMGWANIANGVHTLVS
jgi:hypothetical protein